MADFVHLQWYGLDGSLQHEHIVARVEIVPGFRSMLWEEGVLFRIIMCADGGVYRNEQTGREIITMQMVKMRTCYDYNCHPVNELNRIAEDGDLWEGAGQYEGKYWCGECWRHWIIRYWLG